MDQALVLVPMVVFNVEWHHIDYFSVNKCQHFEGTGRTLWSIMVPSNALKGFPSVPCKRCFFFCEKIQIFLVTAAIKQQQRLKNLTNPTMVCSYRSSCLDLHVALVDFQVEGCPSRLHHVCQGEYVAMNDINIDGGGKKIYRNCVDEIRGHGKSETLKNMGDSTVYGKYKSE